MSILIGLSQQNHFKKFSRAKHVPSFAEGTPRAQRKEYFFSNLAPFASLPESCVFRFAPIQHRSAPGARRQCFDITYDVDDRRTIGSEGLLERAPQLTRSLDSNGEATHRFRNSCQINVFEDPHFTGSAALLSTVGRIK